MKNNLLRYAVITAFIFIANLMYLFAQNINFPVGAIPGVIDVSPMGATTYTIPIEVVSGTQGIQPSLSIVYNSMSGMGLLGMKWSLAGLSAITRCGQTPYYDNDMTAIQFNTKDRFALDGAQLLMQANGTYGTVGATYATEAENFIRVLSYGGSAGLPNYFIAYTDEGTIIEYGNTNDSKQTVATNKVVSWCMNKITDANGNYMTFTYESIYGDIRIKEINYTGNTAANIATYAKVQFGYSTNTLNPCAYFIGGCFIQQTKLLETITVTYNSSQLRKYKFNYNLNDANERTAHLKNIVLYGENNTQINPTTIEWGVQNTTIENPIITNLPDGKILTGDFNGDGFTDIVVYGMGSSQSHWKLYYNDTFGNFEYYIGGSHITDSYVYAYDLDMDGRDELILGEFIEVDDNNDEIWYFTNIRIFPYTQCEIGIVKNFQAAYFGKFYSNGKSDVLFLSCKPAYNALGQFIGYSYKLINSAGSVELDMLDAHIDKRINIQVADINGNGKDDIILVKGNTALTYEYQSGVLTQIHNTDFPTQWHKVYYGDFNGDGIKDALVFVKPDNSASYKWLLHLGKGDNTFIHPGFEITQLDVTPKSSSGMSDPYCPIVIADINGDGKDEITQLTSGSLLYKLIICYLSNFSSTGSCTVLTVDNWIPGYICIPLYSNGFHIGDFNGDGKVDILKGRHEDSQIPWIVYSNENEQYELPQKITDGMGKFYKLTYKPKYCRAENYVRTSATDYYHTYQKYFLPILSELHVQNGINGDMYKFQYLYSDACYSLARRTFLGFKTFTIRDVKSPIIDTRTSNFDFISWNTRQMLAPESYSLYKSGVITTSKTFYYYVQDLPNRRFVSYCGLAIDGDMLSFIRTNTATILNNEGRVKKSFIKKIDMKTNDWLHLDTTTYFYKGIILSNANHQKTVPEKMITTQQYRDNGIDSATFSDTTTYKYNIAGNLTQMRNGNMDGAITTNYGNYSTAGIFLEKTVSAQGCYVRTEKYELDATQRFVTKIIEEPYFQNFSTVISYNAKTGNKLTETDLNGLTTSYTYDNFGTLTKITYPDNTETNISVIWNNSPKPPKALYYTKTTTTAKPELRVYYDTLGREICRLEDSKYYDTRYNEIGQVVKTSYPYTELNTNDLDKIWHNYTYYDNGRKKSENAPYLDVKYDYSYRKVTVTDMLRNNIQTYTNYDALGRMIEAKDEGGIINYEYSLVTQSGKLRHKTQITQGNAVTTILTDLLGNRLSITEPNAGTITSTYNNFGELLSQTDTLFNKTEYLYDRLGRMTQKKYSISGTTQQILDYTYDNYSSSNKGKGKLHQIKIDNVVSETYIYDNLGRLANQTKIIDATSYTHSYTYNAKGQLETFTYPDGFSVTYQYAPTGKISQITNSSDNSLIYKVYGRNKYNLLTGCEYGNGLATRYTYNPYGLVTQILTNNNVKSNSGEDSIGVVLFSTKLLIDTTILNYNYNYNNLGLMISRCDSTVNQFETYTYDNLDRLLSITPAAGSVQTFSYTNNGSITNNSKVGSYLYGNGKPHAVSIITPINPFSISDVECDVTYNFFNQPTQITELPYQLNISYGTNQQRNKMITSRNNTISNTRYYINKYYEKEIDSTNTVRHYHYIYSENGAVALHIGSGRFDNLYYIHTDHLGSYCAITNADKTVKQRNWFDPWGNYLIKYDTIWARKPAPTLVEANFPLSSRGFTGHEHYPMFKIINMNGRLYDPVIGRFFSPDKYVMNGSFTQDFNRYSYARNNPLMYTDPSGHKLKWWQGLLIALGADVLTGGAISLTAAATATAASAAITTNAVSLMAFNTTTYTATLPFQHTLSAIDMTVNFLRSGEGNYQGLYNAVNISLGPLLSFASVFDFDKSASPLEWAMQLYNNLSFGEQLQSSIGRGFAHMQSIGGYVDKVGFYKGRTIVRLKDDYLGDNFFSGISFGHYVFGYDIALNPYDKEHNVDLFAHEFGHTYQSRTSGLLYLFKDGIPSAAGGDLSEADADWRAYMNLGIDPWGRVSWYTEKPNRLKWWESGVGSLLWPFMWLWNR